jgi:hypothetical protein
MAEENIYSDSDVSVTTARIIVSGTTYALSNITSVKMTETAGNSGCAVALIIGRPHQFFLCGSINR